MASLISFMVLFLSVFNGIFGLSFSKQVMTIKIKHNVYDCVDFYKQPAFNHSLLKNLTFKEKRLPNLAKLQRLKIDGIGLEDGGCPIGTVPILRLNPNFTNNNIPYLPADALAVVQTKLADYPRSKRFYGISGGLTLWRAEVKPTQWSTARIKLKNEGESIEVGWRAYPVMYGDKEVHLYTELLSKSCVPPCNPFVQVARGAAIGSIPQNYSKQHVELWGWNLSIDKHEDDGNWWVSINDKKYVIGYWPKEALTSLHVANQVDWGGEVQYASLSFDPDMGSGTMAYYCKLVSATIMQIKVVRGNFKSVDPDEDTTKVWNWEDYYNVLDGGYRGDKYGRMMYYGGAMPYCCCPDSLQRFSINATGGVRENLVNSDQVAQ